MAESRRLSNTKNNLAIKKKIQKHSQKTQQGTNMNISQALLLTRPFQHWQKCQRIIPVSYQWHRYSQTPIHRGATNCRERCAWFMWTVIHWEYHRVDTTRFMQMRSSAHIRPVMSARHDSDLYSDLYPRRACHTSEIRDVRFGSKVGQIGPQIGQIRDFFRSDFSTFGSSS